MPKVFYPLENLTEYVDATCGDGAHPEGTKYKVAIGNEIWDGAFPKVIKVQMVYKETGLQGRRSPSYPVDSDDFKRVMEVGLKLLQKSNSK